MEHRPCSMGSSVLCRSPTPLQRTCPSFGFDPSRTGLRPHRSQALQRSPGSRAYSFSACAGSATTRDHSQAREMYRLICVQPSPCVYRVGVPICRFRSSITRPTDASVYASACSSRSPAARLEVRWFRYSFPAGLFHSLLHAGLSRRSHTTASRAVKRLKKSPPPGPQLRGPSEVFRIVKVIRGISASQLSARNRFLLHCHPVSGVSSGQQHRN